MRFDFVPFFNPGENLPWNRIVKMMREQTQLAEQADFTTVWLTEHQNFIGKLTSLLKSGNLTKLHLNIMPSQMLITLVWLKDSLVKIHKFSKKLATGYSNINIPMKKKMSFFIWRLLQS